MKIICTIALLLYYSLGTMLFPLGDLSYAREIPEMYSKCALEDPDLNVLDFIFEHLANISDDQDCDSKEKPHQPTYQHIPVQASAMFTPKIAIPVALHPIVPAVEKSYPIGINVSLVSSCLTQVFRPPIA